MSELLKAVLKEQSLSAKPCCYVAESGFLTGLTTPPDNAPNDLIVTVEADTYFLVQRIGLQLAVSDETGIVRVPAQPLPYLFTLYDPISTHQYISFGADHNRGGIPSNFYAPCFNDAFDLEEYILLPPLDKLAIKLNVAGVPTSPPQNFAVFFLGTEFKFNQAIDVPSILAQSLNYMPPNKDSARAFSIDPMGGVIPSSGQPLTPSPNVSATGAALQLLMQQQAQLSQMPLTPQVAAQLRFIRHQITQMQAMIQAANATQ